MRLTETAAQTLGFPCGRNVKKRCGHKKKGGGRKGADARGARRRVSPAALFCGHTGNSGGVDFFKDRHRACRCPEDVQKPRRARQKAAVPAGPPA